MFKPTPRVPKPSMGYYVADWMEDTLAMPDRVDYEPFRLTQEQFKFLVNLLRIDEATGEFVYRRAVYSRSKGSGKSPFMGAIACAFGLCEDIIFDHWADDGSPVGCALSDLRTPKIQLAAVSDDQAHNMYSPILEMLRLGPALDLYPGLEALDSYIALPGGGGTGRIETVTASAASREGNRPYLVLMDQTESWTPSIGGVRLAETLRRNNSKVDGISIETPNAYLPGQGSVAEDTADYLNRILEKNLLPIDEGLLWDHREAPPDTDILDEDSLRAGLKYAYGDSTWVNIERLISESRDPSVKIEDFRRYYLNQVSAASDSWISEPQWNAIRPADISKLELSKDDKIVLGFDGSQGRIKGKADATALVAIRIKDRMIFPIKIWEEDENDSDWTTPVAEVDEKISEVFEKYNVLAFFADPAGWTEQIAVWEGRYGKKLKRKGSKTPIATATASTVAAPAVENLRLAITNGELQQNGNQHLKRHILSARKRATRNGYLLYKEHPNSRNKIDGAYALMLAHRALTAILSTGEEGENKKKSRVRIYR